MQVITTHDQVEFLFTLPFARFYFLEADESTVASGAQKTNQESILPAYA